jgi:hypothetical protein
MPRFLVAILAVCVISHPRLASAEAVRVVADGTSIWTTESIPNVLTVVKAGTVLEVKELRAGWYVVALPNDPTRLGRILARLVEPLKGATETPETAGTMRPGPGRTSPAAAERTTAPPTATGVAVATASPETPKTAGAMTPGPARTSRAAAERTTAPPAGTVVPVAAASTSALDLITIVTARAFYNAAAYDNALATLAKLTGNASPEIERAANQYRAGCLYALGRTAEAEAIAEMMIRKDPQVRLDDIEMSPRVLEMFASLRRRLLPK